MFRKVINFFNIFNFWVDFYNQLILWIKVIQLLKDDKVLQNLRACSYKLRINWIGTIYTVINVPEDYMQTEHLTDLYIRQEVEKIDEVLQRDGLADILYPTMEKIEGANSYLLKMSTDKEQLKPIPILFQLFKLFIIFEIFVILFNIFGGAKIEAILNIFKYFTF